MVTTDSEVPSQQVMFVVFNKHFDGQELPVCHAVVSFCPVQGAAPICNHSFAPLLGLGQHCPDTVLRGISIQDKRAFSLRVGHNLGPGQPSF